MVLPAKAGSEAMRSEDAMVLIVFVFTGLDLFVF
jgi:hypothetical protein